MKTVYVAGAYSDVNPDNIKANIATARIFTVKLWNNGFGVLCPHLNSAGMEIDSTAPYETYTAFYLRMIPHCDMLFMLPNWHSSDGARNELNLATKLNIPVYFDINRLLNEQKESK